MGSCGEAKIMAAYLPRSDSKDWRNDTLCSFTPGQCVHAAGFCEAVEMKEQWSADGHILVCCRVRVRVMIYKLR